MKIEEIINEVNSVEEYQKIIQLSLDKIDKLQEVCEHNEASPEMYMYKPGCCYPSLVCKKCKKAVSGITKEQQALVWRNNDNKYANPYWGD